MTSDRHRYSQRMRSHHEASVPLRKLNSGQGSLEKTVSRLETGGGPKAIYIHVPFCKKICTFCNMRRSLSEPTSDYHRQIIREIQNYSAYPQITKGVYNAVYFGGGTPTSLETDGLGEIVKALRDYLPLGENAEITVESSVSELTEEKLDMLRQRGVNRLSLGVQTFSERGRQLLGRKGSGAEAEAKIRRARELGFDNIGMDLIYNYPGQTEEELEGDLERIAHLDMAGFSLYSLIMFNQSILGRRLPQENPGYERAACNEYTFFNNICERFSGGQYDFMDLTKLVQPDRDAYKYINIRHRGGDTLPLGAGAGGQIGDTVFLNPFDLEEYGHWVEAQDQYPLSGYGMDERSRYIHGLLGEIQLGRLNVRSADFWPESGDLLGSFVQSLLADGLAADDPAGCRLTREGIYWGNNISHEIADILVRNMPASGI